MVSMTWFRSIAASILALVPRLLRVLSQCASRRGRQSKTASHEAREQARLVSNVAQELLKDYAVVLIPVDRSPDELGRRAANRLPAGLLREWGEDAKRRKSGKGSPEISACSQAPRETNPPSASQEKESSANYAREPKRRVDSVGIRRLVEEHSVRIGRRRIALLYMAQNESPAPARVHRPDVHSRTGGLIRLLEHALRFLRSIVSCAAAFNTLVTATLVLLAVLSVVFDINILNLVEVLR